MAYRRVCSLMVPALLAIGLAFVVFAAGSGGQPRDRASPSPAASAPGPAPPPSGPSEAALARVLSSLGFRELAAAVSSLPPASLAAWSGEPITVFAPPDDAIRSCRAGCAPARLVSDHVARGLFPLARLSSAAGAELETARPGRCLAIAGAGAGAVSAGGSRVSRADLFRDERVVVHGVEGLAGAAGCARAEGDGGDGAGGDGELKEAGFGVLALAMRVKFAELAALESATVFAVDDAAILGGGAHAYVGSVRFHVVPNRRLGGAELRRLPEGTLLPTLARGEQLVVTRQAGVRVGEVRVNYVPVTRADVVLNPRVAVHAVFLPFPHLLPADLSLLAAAASAASAARPPAPPPATCDAANGPSGVPQRTLSLTASILDFFRS